MKHGSLFTGVGGIDLGFEAAGIETSWQCEIDKQARSVLAHRFPNATQYTDVCGVNGADVTPVDVITFGSPCQDLSVAGKRAGFADGTRSNLYFEAVRIIKEMRDATGNQYPRYAIWENVRGALSSNGGHDFHAAVQALADIGAVDIYWRVVNTCHFGPPQRRVRVFVVADFGGERAGEILAQPTRVCWHPSQIGETRSETSRETENGTGSSGWNTTRDASSTLQTGGVAGTRIDVEAAAGGQLLWCRDVSRVIAAKIAKGTDGPAGDEHHALIAYTKGRRAMSADDYETWDEDRPAPTLNVFDNASETRATVLSVYQYDGYNQKLEEDGTYRTLRTGQDSGDKVAVPTEVLFEPQSMLAENWAEKDIKANLRAEASKSSHAAVSEVDGQYRVRRLTPRECERLQGWPDDHTRYGDGGREISDSARYKMAGNGVSAPVAQWIGENLMAGEQ